MGKVRKTKHVVELSKFDVNGKVQEVTMFIPRVRLAIFTSVKNERGLFRIGPYLGRRLFSVGPLSLIKDVNSEGDVFVKRRVFVV